MIALTEAVKRSALMGLLCALSCSGADATVQDGDKANVHPAGSVEKRRYADALVDALAGKLAARPPVKPRTD